jgi:hypothetical protein
MCQICDPSIGPVDRLHLACVNHLSFSLSQERRNWRNQVVQDVLESILQISGTRALCRQTECRQTECRQTECCFYNIRPNVTRLNVAQMK